MHHSSSCDVCWQLHFIMTTSKFNINIAISNIFLISDPNNHNTKCTTTCWRRRVCERKAKTYENIWNLSMESRETKWKTIYAKVWGWHERLCSDGAGCIVKNKKWNRSNINFPSFMSRRYLWVMLDEHWWYKYIGMY